MISGVAPTTLDDRGQVFDWMRATAGAFLIHSQKHRPRNAEVAVHDRGYWYYIACDDVNTLAVLSVLETLFSPEESAERPGGPLLTLPLGAESFRKWWRRKRSVRVGVRERGGVLAQIFLDTQFLAGVLGAHVAHRAEDRTLGPPRAIIAAEAPEDSAV